MATPAEARAEAATSAPAGFIVQPGVDAFRKELGGKPTAFAQWRANPVTKLVIRALQGLSLHPPAVLGQQDALVQYGVTQGLALAVQLCVDPSLLWPGMFDAGGGTPPEAPDMDFGTSIDDMFTPKEN